MATYQRMISKLDPQPDVKIASNLHYGTVNYSELMLFSRYFDQAFMTLWDVKPRVEESSLETLSVDELITQLRQMCEDAEDRASNAQEEARQKRKEALEKVVQQIYRNNN
ncbi:hypothetical protein Tco_0078879 [Tanacetum coccineum]